MKILFAGDFSVQNRSVALFQNTEKSVEAFKDVAKLTAKSDFSIVNFESPVTSASEPILKDGPCLKNPESALDVLKKVGFDVLTLANNHLKDFGIQGVVDTIDKAKNAGFHIVGAGESAKVARKPLLLEQDGERVGILNVCENESSIAADSEPGANPVNEINMYYDITALKGKVDYIVVIIHGGREHYNLPTPRMKKLYHYIIDLGADLVVNHHQHCYSGYEIYKGKPIFYGLGNFYFDKKCIRDFEWNKGLLVSVDFGREITFEALPIIQCKEQPIVRVGQWKDVEPDVFKLNKVISDNQMLEMAYNQEVYQAKPLSSMEPYQSHYVMALYNRGFLPDVISQKKKARILNAIRCESHRELLVKYLEKQLGQWEA